MSHPPLPRRWNRHVKSALLNALSMARHCFVVTAAQLSTSKRKADRLTAENARLRHEVELLREELRIKDRRMARVPCRRRPHYTPIERMSILELQALRGWSLARTAEVFLLTRATVSSWINRLRRGEDGALLRFRQPVNRFPDFVRHLVQRLKILCPRLGKVKIAQMLCRAGIHLGPTTVGRILREPTPKPPSEGAAPPLTVAEHPDHVWHIDLTTIPTSMGFWTPYAPNSSSLAWPFCWWIAVVFDQFSRRVVDFAIYRKHPNSDDVCALLERATEAAQRKPSCLVSDGEGQFVSDVTRAWLRKHSIEPRVGRLGQPGSIAVLDRFFLTLKETCRVLVPFNADDKQQELELFLSWYNAHRAHTSLDGATPDEVYFGMKPACEKPRLEPRPRWPSRAPSAQPRAAIDSRTKVVDIRIHFLAGRKHLPVIAVKRAA